MSQLQTPLDSLIIGGGPAGLSAALLLGRSRKHVRVIDAGAPRHRVSDGVHNFLTRDGMPPQALRQVSWEQMKPYKTVQRCENRTILSLKWDGKLWSAQDDAGETHWAKAIVLATGMVDEHPDIPGYRERWGRSIFLCPYCHGWEMQDRPLAVFAQSEEGMTHLPLMLRGWTDDIALFTHGESVSDAAEQALKKAGIQIYSQRITALDGPGDSLESIHLEDGQCIKRSGLFAALSQHQIPLIAELDLEFSEMGYVKVDDLQKTNLPMVWAAGDITTRLQFVAGAVASGAMAGAFLNAHLTMGLGDIHDE